MCSGRSLILINERQLTWSWCGGADTTGPGLRTSTWLLQSMPTFFQLRLRPWSKSSRSIVSQSIRTPQRAAPGNCPHGGFHMELWFSRCWPDRLEIRGFHEQLFTFAAIVLYSLRHCSRWKWATASSMVRPQWMNVIRPYPKLTVPIRNSEIYSISAKCSVSLSPQQNTQNDWPIYIISEWLALHQFYPMSPDLCLEQFLWIPSAKAVRKVSLAHSSLICTVLWLHRYRKHRQKRGVIPSQDCRWRTFVSRSGKHHHFRLHLRLHC